MLQNSPCIVARSRKPDYEMVGYEARRGGGDYADMVSALVCVWMVAPRPQVPVCSAPSDSQSSAPQDNQMAHGPLNPYQQQRNACHQDSILHMAYAEVGARSLSP